MGSFLRPVGSEPPAVYWRRRILVFGIPLILVAFTAYACSGSGNGAGNGAKSGASANPTGSSAIITPGAVPTGTLPPINSYPVTGPTGSATATSSSGTGIGGSNGGATGGATSGSGGSVGGVPVGSSGCVLSVEMQLDKSSTSGPPVYAAGQNPTFHVILKNSGTANCLFDVSGKGVVVTVTQVGSTAAAWTSATCSGSSDMRVLGPGDGYTDFVKWTREKSGTTCPSTQTVQAGSYAVTAAVDGVSAASVQFTLQ